MSTWRREASARMPELNYITEHLSIDSPMMLWIELRIKFDGLCLETPRPWELLRRIWSYADWCMWQSSGDVQTAAVAAFGEHLLETPNAREILPQIMPRSDFLNLKHVLLAQSSEELFQSCLTGFTDSTKPCELIGEERGSGFQE